MGGMPRPIARYAAAGCNTANACAGASLLLTTYPSVPILSLLHCLCPVWCVPALCVRRPHFHCLRARWHACLPDGLYWGLNLLPACPAHYARYADPVACLDGGRRPSTTAPRRRRGYAMAAAIPTRTARYVNSTIFFCAWRHGMACSRVGKGDRGDMAILMKLPFCLRATFAICSVAGWGERGAGYIRAAMRRGGPWAGGCRLLHHRAVILLSACGVWRGGRLARLPFLPSVRQALP